jgi:hypothetical protein
MIEEIEQRAKEKKMRQSKSKKQSVFGRGCNFETFLD